MVARRFASGRGALPNVLIAGTLAALHAQLPSGLVRSQRMPGDPHRVIGVWCPPQS